MAQEQEVGEFWANVSKNLQDQSTFGRQLRDLNLILVWQPYLDAFEISPVDDFIYDILDVHPVWQRMIKGRNKPEHIYRWFFQIRSQRDQYYQNLKPCDYQVLKAAYTKDLLLMKTLASYANLEIAEEQTGKQAIHVAWELGDLEMLQLLLKAGVDIETQNVVGHTPIHSAGNANQLEIVSYLVHEGAGIDHPEKTRGRSIFGWACRNKQMELMDVLIDLGADVNFTSQREKRPPLTRAAINKSIPVVERLLKIPEVNIDMEDNKGRNALQHAVQMSKVQAGLDVTEMLLKAGANTEHGDQFGETPIFIGMSINCPEVIEMLIRYGADMYAVSDRGLLPIHRGCTGGHVEAVRTLLNHGVDCNTLATNGYTPLHCAIQKQTIGILNLLLSLPDIKFDETHIETALYNRDRLAILLQLYGVPLTIGVLETAVNCGFTESVEYLLNFQQFDITQEILEKVACLKCPLVLMATLEHWQSTIPLSVFLAAVENEPCLRLLLAYPHDDALIGLVHRWINAGSYSVAIEILESSPDLCNDVDTTGQLPLHAAAKQGHTELVNILVTNMDPELLELKDSQGCRAQDYAIINGYHYIAALLGKETGFTILKLGYQDLDEEVLAHVCEKPLAWDFSIKNPIEDHKSDEVHFIDTHELWDFALTKLRSFSIIGVDIEYWTFSSNRGCMCLIQLSNGAVDFVLDMLKIGEYIAPSLREIFLNPEVLKILHGCSSDIQWLKFGYDIYVVNAFDTGVAYSILNDEKQTPGLAFLLKNLMGIEMDKMYQVSDWRIRPLPQPMINYARLDAHYLPFLYEILRDQMTPNQLSQTAEAVENLLFKVSSKLKRIRVYIKNQLGQTIFVPRQNKMDELWKVYKTKHCTNAQQMRKCPNLKQCRFYHDESDRRRAMDIKYLPILCLQAIDNAYCPNVACKYCRNYEEFLYHPLNFKSRYWIYQKRGMMCYKGQTCPFYHNAEEQHSYRQFRERNVSDEVEGYDSDLSSGFEEKKQAPRKRTEKKRVSTPELGETKLVLNSEIPLYEDKTTEFKQFAGGISSKYMSEVMSNVICAFLNTIGGILYLGVKDDGLICGVRLSRSARDSLSRDIDGILNTFQPSVSPQLIKLEHLPVHNSGKEEIRDLYVIRIEVLEGNPSTLYSTPKGEAYCRRDSSNYRLKSISEVTEYFSQRNDIKKNN